MKRLKRYNRKGNVNINQTGLSLDAGKKNTNGYKCLSGNEQRNLNVKQTLCNVMELLLLKHDNDIVVMQEIVFILRRRILNDFAMTGL